MNTPNKLRELFDKLPKEQQNLLVEHLDNDTDHLIRITNELVIGVYLERDPSVEILEQEGPWSYGRLSH